MNSYQLVKNTEWKEVEINGEMKEIPEGWDVKKFNEFSSICRGGSPRPIQNFLTDKKDGTPWIKISDATKVTKYIDSTEQYIIKEGESRSRLVYPGDLIVSNSATPGIPRFLNITACIHDGWLLLRDFKEVDKEFLFQLVGLVREKLKSQGSGSIFTNLSIDILSNFECVIPPIQTQSSIASILSEQESIIQDIESLISKYESRFQYLSDELLSGRLRVKEVDGEVVLYKNTEDNWKEVEINGEVKEIPKDWEVDKLINIGNLFAGKRKKYEPTQEELKNNDIYFSLGGEHIGERTFDLKNKIFVSKDFFNKSLKGQVSNNDILIIKDGATTGKNIFVKNMPIKSMLLNEHVYRFVATNVSPFYLYLLFNGKDVQTILEEKINGIIPSLNQENFSQIETSLTKNFNEQKLISSIILMQESLIEEQSNLLIKEKNKFSWLLDNLLSGKYLIKE